MAQAIADVEVVPTSGLDFLRDPYGFLALELPRRQGWFRVDMGSEGTYVFISSPALIAELQAADPSVFRGDGGNRILEPLLGAHSLLLQEGRAHQRQRRFLRPTLARGPAFGMYPSIVRRTRAMVEGWGAQVELREELHHLALDIILDLLFGDVRTPLNSLTQLIHNILNSPQLTPMGLTLLGNGEVRAPSLRALAEDIEATRAVILALVERRREDPGQGGALDLLLEMRDEDGVGLSDAELVDELLTLVITGHETSVTTLLWCHHWLLGRSDVLDDFLSWHAEHPVLDARKTMDDRWLDSFFREVLRFHPIVPIVARGVARDTTLGGRALHEGETVAVAISALHHDPDAFPEPERFDPARFVEVRPSPQTFMPFGMGRRRCLGALMAELEVKTILHTMWSERAYERVGPPQHFKRRLVTMTPGHDMKVHVRARRHR